MRKLLVHELDEVEDWGRLEAVYALDAGDEHVRARLDALCGRTTAATGLPIGMVTVLDRSAASFAGSCGLTGWMARARAVPVELAPCVRVVATGAPVVVEDLRADAVHRDNPLVRHYGLAAYAGAPVRGASGRVLGAACVFGTEARAFTPEDVSAVQAAADEAGAVLRGRGQR